MTPKGKKQCACMEINMLKNTSAISHIEPSGAEMLELGIF